MSSPLNPINVRLPLFDLESEEGRQSAHRYLASGIVDLNQAIAALHNNVQKSINTQTTVFESSGGGGGGGGGITGLGGVNDQLGQAAYTTQQSDNGAKIIVGDASPVAVTLSSAITTPWFTIIDNDSSAVANLAPSSGSLFGEQSIPPGGFGIIYFDGADFWCGATNVPDGVSIGISGGVTRTIGIDSTIATAPLTPTGSPGSMTFSNGLLVSAVQAT